MHPTARREESSRACHIREESRFQKRTALSSRHRRAHLRAVPRSWHEALSRRRARALCVMGRRGRARQQPDENCRLANETIVSQTSQTKSRVALSFRFSPWKPACFSQPQSSTRSPEIRNNNGLRMTVENQPRPAKSLKFLLSTLFFLQKRSFAPETRLSACGRLRTAQQGDFLREVF